MTLFERGEALSHLSALYAECGEGQERGAVITGAVGTGKTEIMRTFARDAIADGAVYCDAIASVAERTLQFGVIGQVFMSPELPMEARERAARLLEAGVIPAQVDHAHPNDLSTDKDRACVSHSLSKILADVADDLDRPLLIAIDDAHNADPASLQCLSSIIGRLRRVRFMLIISAANGLQLFNPGFLAVLPPEPYYRYIRLDLLAERGVESMLAEQIGNNSAKQLAAQCHAISGGNPIIVNSLIHDYWRSAKNSENQHLVIGPETIRAFLAMLHRCDSSMLGLARWLAIIGEWEDPTIAGRLAGLDNESTSRTLSALDCTGCFDGGRFRHPGLCAAVLDGLAPTEQAAMHARAAELLRIEGASAPVIADHLLAAKEPQAAWALPVLNGAAEQALSNGGVSRALNYLRLAQRLPTWQPHSEVTRAMLARAEWRINPALTMRHGTELITALQSGSFAGQDLPAWVSRLMWFGRADEAREVLRHIGDASEARSQIRIGQLDALQVWLSYLFPASHEAERTILAPDGVQSTPATVNPVLQAISLLVSTLTDGPGELTTSAEHLIEESPLNERTFGPVAAALATLLYGGQLGTADKWCAALQKDAAAQEAPTWQAVFAGLHSMIALRQGDLCAAETYAGTALAIIPTEGWGIGIVAPLSVLINVATLTGRYKKASAYLRTPVPDVLFETPPGMYYLQARGRFHCAKEDFRAALRDFQFIAHLMARWQMDLPTLVPWRSDAALAYLRLGRNELAHDLVVEQLKMLAPAHARERGTSLRMLAECGDPSKRLGRLGKAVKELQNSDDRLELAHALADLGRAYHAHGEIGQARKVRRRAHQIAKQCGASVLSNTLCPAQGTESADEEDKGNVNVALEPYRVLSKAEMRVAALAADGFSNRQIADKLFVTVSTVEQHLTRVYSKLKVGRRSDLPFWLHYGASELRLTGPGNRTRIPCMP
jgi:DNA-binding CsgD family transcriptional regulator